MQNIINNTKQKIFLICLLAIIAVSAASVRADQSLVNVTTGIRPTAVAVNAVTNRTYIANRDSNTVTVINGADVSATHTVNVGTYPVAVAVNVETNRIYVVNQNSSDVTVINGADNSTQTIAVGTLPVAVALNPETNRVYVVNKTGKSVTVISGADNSTSTVNLPQNVDPVTVAVNPVTNLIYVGNRLFSGLTVINGADNSTQTVGVGTFPVARAVNPATSRVYVLNRDSNSVTVIDAANNNAVSTVAVGTLPVALAVNPATNRIYVVNQTSNNVTIINGANNSTQTVVVGANPNDVAVNPTTNRIYVANIGSGTTVGSLTVINGADSSTAAVASGNSFKFVAVNPANNRIYAATAIQIFVINGADNSSQNFRAPGDIFGLTVNPTSDQVYALSFNVFRFDGATKTFLNILVGGVPQNLAVNGRTKQVFVANFISQNVQLLTPNNVSDVPLTTSATPSGFTDNTTTTNTPTFNFSATSNYAPNAPAPLNIYFQIDAQQGEWIGATPTGSSGNALTAAAQTSFLTNGLHTIYYYATDGTSSTSINAPGGSPITGRIGSYQFLVNTAPVPPSTFAISGQITSSGAGLAGVMVTLSGSSSGMTSTDANGNYTFANLASGGNYTVTPTKTSYTFTPASANFSNLNANQTANFTAAATTVGTASVSAGTTTAASGGTAVVPIRLDSTNVANVQFTITYDPAKLSIASLAAITNRAPNISFTFNNSTPGQLGVTAAQSAGVAFPASTSLFNINFTVIDGAANGRTTINFSNTPVPIRAFDPQANAATITTTPGAVTISRRRR